MRQYARSLRSRPSEAEKTLWLFLRNKQMNGCKFRRQHVIGPYIVDFVCLQKNLIVEVDGGQHVSQEEYDTKRTQFLRSKGYVVLHFWNNQVLSQIEGVLELIQRFLKGNINSSPPSLPTNDVGRNQKK